MPRPVEPLAFHPPNGLIPGQAPVIAWQPALWLALGTATGSYLASRWTVVKGAAMVRRVVVLIASLSLLEQAVQIVLLLLRQ